MPDKHPKVEQGTIDEITPHDDNANIGTERGRAMLEHSVQTYGMGRSILLDRNNRIIAGNHVHEVAGTIGIEGVVFVHTTGDQVVAVVRDDLDLDDPEAQALAMYDNRTAEVGIRYKPDAVAALLQRQPEEGRKMFTEGEMRALLQEAGDQMLLKSESETRHQNTKIECVCPNCNNRHLIGDPDGV